MPPSPSPEPIETLSFEEAMRRLEEIVSQLESGSVDLERSIALYEQGAALKQHCEAKLKSAETRVDQIVRGADGAASGAAPFDASS